MCRCEGEDENQLREITMPVRVFEREERRVGSRVGEEGCPNEFGENGLRNKKVETIFQKI